MFLKRLELQGFKSFADKTTLDFPSNVAAIVGPNGSGKSNVTDGIRWLLGERDAKNLRGGKVEDLIFAGTEKRAKLGLAQASLYFDNSSGFFPVEFKEVVISRRVSRDGVSQFFLNKSEVRLKDIIDFFARSRIGARGLTIIGQGESDVFIKASPEGRREMIEEILGLKEYQIKKSDAKRRLKNTAINLDKVNALIEEIKPHLRILKKQVARYEGREGFAAELRELEDNFYGSRLKNLRAETGNVEPRKKEIEESIKKGEEFIRNAELELEKVKNSEPEANKKIKEIRDKKSELLSKKYNLQRELGRIEAQLEFSAVKQEVKGINFAKAVEEIKAVAVSLAEEEDLGKIREGIRRILNIINGPSKNPVPAPAPVSDKSIEIKKINEKLTHDLKAIDEDLENIGKIEQSLASELENFNSNFRKAFLNVESEKNKLGRLHEEKNRISFEKERFDLKMKDLHEQLIEIGRKLHEFENWSGVAPEDNDASLKRMFRLRAELAGIGEVDQNVVREAKETEERFNFLTSQVSDLGRAIADLKALIKELDSKIHHEFSMAIKTINEEFTKFMKLMFGGGSASLVLQAKKEVVVDPSAVSADGAVIPLEAEDEDIIPGIDIDITLPKKRIKGLDVLSGGERTLVSIAALFAFISVSPPPFLVLDEVDAALDEKNARRFSDILKEFEKKTQFIIVTHNRSTMEAADVLYGVTMSPDGTSKIVSLKLT
jgi:chromosome segregation protein